MLVGDWGDVQGKAWKTHRHINLIFAPETLLFKFYPSFPRHSVNGFPTVRTSGTENAFQGRRINTQSLLLAAKAMHYLCLCSVMLTALGAALPQGLHSGAALLDPHRGRGSLAEL